MKTILVDIRSILPGGSNGGAKYFVLDLLGELIKKNKSKYDYVFLVRSSVKKEVSRLKGAKVVASIFDNNENFLSKYFKKIILNNFLKKNKIDLLFSPFGAMCYKTPSVPVVSIIYDTLFLKFPTHFPPSEIKNRTKILEGIIEHSTKIICISNFTKNSILQIFPNISDKIKTIYINLRNEKSKKLINNKNILEGYSLLDRNYIFYPANFWQHKNHEMLMMAFNIFKRNDTSGLKLVFTGSDSLRKNFLSKYNLNEDIIFLDYLNQLNKDAIFNSCKGLIFPSLYEGFGMPIVEASMLDVPIALSNIEAHKEIGSGIDNLEFFNPYDLKSIVEAFEFLRDAKRKKRKKIFFTDVDGMANEYISIFDSIMTCDSNE